MNTPFFDASGKLEINRESICLWLKQGLFGTKQNSRNKYSVLAETLPGIPQFEITSSNNHCLFRGG
jgi:hypothetical protein